MNFTTLISQYSKKGRKGYNPIMIYAIILYANMRGIFSVDKIVESLNRDIGFIWLANGEKPKRDVFYDFINEKLTVEILEDLHYQFIRKLKKENYLTLNKLFLDGTKIEANAGRYTFVWRGSINYRVVNLLDQIDILFNQFNNFMKSNNFDNKYNIPNKEMFFVEGQEKVKEVIKNNRERKLNNKKKISNNTLLEIDSISPIDMLKTASILSDIAKEEGIIFVNKKGNKKSELQKLYESFLEKGERLLKYKNYFETMGTDRNSFSKTDIEATFMRMKEDHMRNGQLKAAYNLQFAVENYFIVHVHVSNDRTDYNTLIPIVEKHKVHFKGMLEEFIADSGYASEKNFVYLKENQIESFIKLQEHEKKKTRKYHENISKYYNMDVVESIDPAGNSIKGYVCHDGRTLNHVKTEVHSSNGFERIFEVYSSESCNGCEHKSNCLYKFNPEKHQAKNKTMKVNVRWDNLKEWSEQNVLSETGILYRQIRSVMTEGSFGDMKENDQFRRFHRRGSEKVKKEILLYSMSRNINKYFRYEHDMLKNFEGNAA
ncbi:MAG: transposase [Bacillota bacterium]|nr:transposase [Bacillota bacterium]